MLTHFICSLVIPMVAQGQKYSWCQSPERSCIGHRYGFEEGKALFEDLHFSHKNDWPRFVDWDGDGDMDFIAGECNKSSHRNGCSETMLLFFFEHISSNGSFVPHELLKLNGTTLQPVISFQVADWDNDGQSDLLVCTLGGGTVAVSWLKRAAATEFADAEVPGCFLLAAFFLLLSIFVLLNVTAQIIL